MLESEKVYGGIPQGTSLVGGLIKGYVPLPRYLTMICITLMSFMTGPHHFNFPPHRAILLRGNTYSWRCLPEGHPDATHTTQIGEDGYCIAQKGAVGKLSIIICSTHFVFSFIAGQIADIVSPKIQGVVSLFIGAAGWSMIYLGTQAFQTFIPGAILLGISQDSSFFPMLHSRTLFPRNENMAIAIAGTGRSLSVNLCMAMGFFFLGTDAPQKAAITLLIIYAIAILLMYCSVPWKHPKSIGGDEGTQSFIQQMRELKGYLSSPYFLLYVPCALIFLIRPTFVGTLAGDILKDPVSANVYQIVTAISFIPCPIFGAMVDSYGIGVVGQIVNLSGLLSIAAVLVDSLIPGGCTAMLHIMTIGHCINASFIMSQFYCYVKETFPPQHMNKIAGVLVTLGGLSTFSSDALYQYSLRVGNFRVGSSVMLFFSILASALLFTIQILKGRDPRFSKSLPEKPAAVAA